jgi:Fe-S-cluster-containing dehydrogenase component
MSRYGIVIDLGRCVGCDACSIACKAQNATPRGVLWNRVLKYETGIYPNPKLKFLPMQCMHCAEPECLRVCPTGAISKRPDGIVVIDQDKCMGCRYCGLACPYATPNYLDKVCNYYEGYMTPYEKTGYLKHAPGTSEKCDFCLERVENGLEPACVASCVGKARYFGDLDNPQSEVSQLIKTRDNFILNPEMGTQPSCYYIAQRDIR